MPEEPKYQFDVEKGRKHKVARLKVSKRKLTLMLPPDTSEDQEKIYRRVSAAILLKCIDTDIPGTLWGKFEYKYSGIVMTHQGKEVLSYFDEDAYRQDHKIMTPDEVRMILNPQDDPSVFQQAGVLDVLPRKSLGDGRIEVVSH